MGTETTPRPQKKDEEIVALQFGPFELDLRSGEIHRGGVLLKLQPQPFKVLALLASHAGELVTREEIQHEVWPAGTFVDFEQSLNFCIRQIRAVIGDSALTPRYVETLPRRGYRWIGGPVEKIGAGPAILEWRRPAAVERAEPLPEDDAPPSEALPAIAPPPPRRLAIALWTAAALVALGIAAYVLRAPRTATPGASFQRLTFRRGSIEAARFAPDGQVVISATWEGDGPGLFASRIETRESRRLDVPGSLLVGVSRQGEVAYLKERTLARAPIAGGPPREVLAGVIAADWTPDGSEFVVMRRVKQTIQLEFPIGTVLCDVVATGWTYARISPDGRRVAFLEHPMAGDDRGSVAVVDRKGNKRTLSDGWASIRGIGWSPSGDEVWFTATRVGADSALHAVTLDGRLRTILPAMGRLVLHDIAPDGRLLIERAALRSEIRFRRLAEPEDRDLSWLDLSTLEDLSPDGRTVLFMESGEGGGPEYTMFLRKTDGSLPVRLGTGRAMGLSPDGSSVLSISLRNRDRIDLVPTGAGETRVLRNPGLSEYEWAGFVPPTGTTIHYSARDRDGNRRIYLQDLQGGVPRPFLPEARSLGPRMFSADGQVAVAECTPPPSTKEAGKGEAAKSEWPGFCLYPTAGGEPRPIPGLEKRSWPIGWDDAGRLYVSERDYKTSISRVSRVDPKTGRAEPWRDVTPPDRAGVTGGAKIMVARDGQSFAYSYTRNLSELYVVSGAH